FDRLTREEQERLLTAVKVFVAERSWEGCSGLVLTDEIKVTIAGHACRMLLGLRHDYFGHVPAILVYPSAFLVPPDEQAQGVAGPTAALGQAWYRGPVVLAWDEVLEDSLDVGTGQNVVLHEFAHQLDYLGESGNLDQTRQGAEQ